MSKYSNVQVLEIYEYLPIEIIFLLIAEHDNIEFSRVERVEPVEHNGVPQSTHEYINNCLH